MIHLSAQKVNMEPLDLDASIPDEDHPNHALQSPNQGA